MWMSWSCVGLMAALVAETSTRWIMPRVAPALADDTHAWIVFWTSVVAASTAAFVAGGWLIKTRLPTALASTPSAMRKERAELQAGAADSG
jgi:hypothetical protein